DIADVDKASYDMYRHIIDLTRDMPWIASVVTDRGAPVSVIAVVHHTAADGAASLILEEDLLALLAGEQPQPANSVIALSKRQSSGEGAARQRASERYWRRTMEATPRRELGPRSGNYMGATLRTGIPLPRLHDGADKLNVSLATCVLTAFYRGLCEVTGTTTHLMLAMSNNRFESD